MTESLNSTPRSSAVPRRAAAVIIVALLPAGAAGAGWWYFSRPTAPVWDRVGTLNLFAPAGDAFDEGTPWVSLEFAPSAANTDVPVTLRLENRRGTPTPDDD